MLKARRATIEPDINVTPLVDVVLVLLIIFMVVAPQLERDVAVNLPGIFNVDPEVEGNLNPIELTVAKPGEYHIDEQQFDLEGALNYLRDQAALDPARRLLLRADAGLPYAEIRMLMGRVKALGFPGLNFMVGERHREGAVRATADYSTLLPPAEGAGGTETIPEPGIATEAAPAAVEGEGLATPADAPPAEGN